jgi:uncharacterized protein YbjT (DUF2867 family)
MYAITGITGKAGGELAHNLLDGGQRVRAIVRTQARVKRGLRVVAKSRSPRWRTA